MECIITYSAQVAPSCHETRHSVQKDSMQWSQSNRNIEGPLLNTCTSQHKSGLAFVDGIVLECKNTFHGGAD